MTSGKVQPGQGKRRFRRARRAVLALAAAAALVAAASPDSPAQAEEPVTIFAAASTTSAINEIAALYEDRGLGAVRPVFAASSTLAKQIARGAPADLFLSANVAWMDYLTERDQLAGDSRDDLLGNSLVLIAPKDGAPSDPVALDPGLADALGDGRLAMGDPDHVPAGLYAKAALERLGAWPPLARRTAFAANVRAALALVERGAAAAGIVYASDATISSRVTVLAEFPGDSHPAIVYPLAVVAERERPAVTAFRDFLRSPDAREIFARSGFRLLDPQS